MSISSIHSIQPLPEVQNHSLDSELFEALKSKDNFKLEKLLKQGADANTTFELDEDAINVILESVFSKEELEESFLEPLIFVVVIATVYEETGISPLFFAAHSRNLDAMRLLIEHGADVHFKVLDEGVEYSPLQIEALDKGKILEVLEILHENGLAIEEMVSDDYTSPLELLEAAKNENNTELVDFLERHGYHI